MKRNRLRLYSTMFLLIVALSIQKTLAQIDTSGGYKFQVKIEKRSNNKRPVPKRDSVYINFDYGYQDDIIRIKTEDKIIVSDTLNADNVYGIAGHLRIAKTDLRKPIDIYFNDVFLKRIKVKTRFSSVHLEFNREKRLFTWRYMRYKFVYL